MLKLKNCKIDTNQNFHTSEPIVVEPAVLISILHFELISYLKKNLSKINLSLNSLNFLKTIPLLLIFRTGITRF